MAKGKQRVVEEMGGEVGKRQRKAERSDGRTMTKRKERVEGER